MRYIKRNLLVFVAAGRPGQAGKSFDYEKNEGAEICYFFGGGSFF
jgi:hypothetical protein